MIVILPRINVRAGSIRERLWITQVNVRAGSGPERYAITQLAKPALLEAKFYSRFKSITAGPGGDML